MADNIKELKQKDLYMATLVSKRIIAIKDLLKTIRKQKVELELLKKKLAKENICFSFSDCLEVHEKELEERKVKLEKYVSDLMAEFIKGLKIGGIYEISQKELNIAPAELTNLTLNHFTEKELQENKCIISVLVTDNEGNYTDKSELFSINLSTGYLSKIDSPDDI